MTDKPTSSCCPAPNLKIIEATPTDPDKVQCDACGKLDLLVTFAETIEMRPVISNNVAGIGYEPALHILRVDFKHGGRYAFFPVSVELWERMCNPESSV